MRPVGYRGQERFHVEEVQTPCGEALLLDVEQHARNDHVALVVLHPDIQRHEPHMLRQALVSDLLEQLPHPARIRAPMHG